jgi:hypothetical protein
MEVNDVPTRTLRAAVAAALTGAGLLAAAPAAHADGAPASCTPKAASAHPFAAWDDSGLYTLVDGGDMESGLGGWTATGSAHVVEGNEPFQVGGGADHLALALGPDDSVISAPICIDDGYPWFRFFARNTSGRRGKLKVDVLYADAGGKLRQAGTGDYATSESDWRPTGSLDISIDFADVAGGALPVAFRFTAQPGSSFDLDDVYVDPMARG